MKSKQTKQNRNKTKPIKNDTNTKIEMKRNEVKQHHNKLINLPYLKKKKKIVAYCLNEGLNTQFKMFKFSLNVNHIRHESIKLFVYFIFLFDFCFSFIWLGLVWLGFFFSFRFRFARNWYPVDMRRRFSVDYHTLFSTNLVIRFDFSQNQTESENQIENRIV